MPDPQFVDRPLTPDEQKSVDVPQGSERTRQDTNIIGIDHDKIMQKIADWSSKLPSPIRKYVAQTAAFHADALASLIEMASSPENAATVGAMTAPNAIEAGASVAPKVAAAAKVAKDVATNPDVVGVVAPRTANAIRLAQKVKGAIEQSTAAQPDQVIIPPVTPAATPAPIITPPMTPASAPAVAPAATKGFLNAAETKEYVRLMRSGKSSQEAMELIQQMRAFSKGKGLPSTADVRSSVVSRNASGTWDEQ